MPDFSIADILSRGYQQRAPLLQQQYGLGAAVPAIGQAIQTGVQNRSVLQAQKDYSDYLSLPDEEKRKPENAQRGYQAAISLGITPQAQPQDQVSPDIWAQIQKEGGFQTGAKGTKENVQAGETLARLKGSSKAEGAKVRDEAKQKQGDEKFWAQNFKLFTPTNAPRGSLIGQAAFGNARADRALTTLNDPKITPQQIQAVVNDFAGIMQGGAPHADAIKELGFNTLVSDWQNLMTRITSNPREANQPEVVAKLRQMVTEIKNVDNQIIQNNMDTFEAANSEQITRNPQKWAKIRGSITRGTFVPGQTAGTSAPQAQAAPNTKDPLGIL